MDNKDIKKLAPSFTKLNVAQFLGAMNDNILKLLIIFFLIHLHGKSSSAMVTATVGAAFALPFLLFSAPAGCLADRLAKSKIIVIFKVFEAAVTLLAMAAFFMGWQSGLYVVVFLMATHSAFFSPAKYGIIPELAEREQLSRANGLIESFTYMAIIFGTTTASLLAEAVGDSYWLSALLCVIIALIGLWSAVAIKPTVAADSHRKVALFPSDILRTIISIRSDRFLMLAIVGQAWFMLIGAFAQFNLIGYGMQELKLTEAQGGFLFLAAALGIGGGSLLAAKLSGRDVEFGIVPIGALGLTVSPILLHLLPANISVCVAILVLFGVSAGLFSLPLQTFIQFKADPARRGEVLAAASFINWIAILIASGLTWLLGGLMGLSAAQGFSIVGAATMLLTLLSFWLLPDFLLRFVALATMRIFYKLRIIGAENLPIEGPALLIPNHVTWVDALLLFATNQRRIRFVMERKIYNTPLLNALFKLMGVIPVSSTDGKKELLDFIKRARQALDDGYMVCIFAEGELTRNGMLREFRGGFERIVRNSDHPIIPVYIGGAWGSILSYAHGKLLSRLPAFSPYPVTVIFGKPMPSNSSAASVRQQVAELSCDWFSACKPLRKPLEQYLISSARQNWGRRAVNDTSGKLLSYGNTLTAAVALAAKLEKNLTTKEQSAKHIGILLPPSVGGVLANIALMLMDKIPVNLNYTASETSIKSALSQCGIKTIICSKAFIEKLPTLAALEDMIMLEELLPSITAMDKFSALLKARFAPAGMLFNRKNFSADDVATVIFSSGSTGEPKGVMLSHHNIMSNIEALRMVFRVNLNDNVCSALPFFHSLGFTGTLWFPLVSGFSSSYHPNPMDGEKIAQLVRENSSTMLIATPTFLLAYIRKAKREDFRSLRLVVTGAEKLKSKIADSFQEKFGIRPMEGYGTTELAPVIALSLPDVEIGGVRQYGSKDGSVGHPIPGVAIKIVDAESGELLKPGKSGLILVKGPNLMLGYIGRADKTIEAMRNGWYVTGDIGIMDDDGFIRITDRLSRFSKIAGEMVPHGVIEDELHNSLGQAGVVAVTAVPDEKKGERLVVLFEREATSAEVLHSFMSASDLPNLWKPGSSSYIAVDALPILGTGKIDLKAIKDIALANAGGCLP